MAHLGSSPGENFKKVVNFLNRFNSVASLSNNVNKISNMILHIIKEHWLINITLQIIFNMIIKNCIRVYQN